MGFSAGLGFIVDTDGDGSNDGKVVTLKKGSNITLSLTGSTLTISSTGGSGAVRTVTVDGVALDSSESLDLVSGEGIDLSESGGDVTIAGEDATTTNKGIASFSSDNFDVTSGAVKIKAGGVDLTNEVTGTLPVANGGTGATSLNDLITLGTHTTGNYVATIADSGGGTITVANSGSESAGVTLAVDTSVIASKTYVDSVAQGLRVADAVAVATTTNITLSGEQTIDGITTSTSRVLVKNQSTATENGIYVSASGAWARASDMNADTSPNEFPGTFVFVSGGTTNADLGFVCTVDTDFDLGTDDVTFSQFSSAGHITAGSGLDKSGNTMSVDVSDFMTNGADNRVLTATGTDGINAESGLTFDGDDLTILGSASGKPTLTLENTASVASAAGEPEVIFLRSGASNAATSGDLGRILFKGLDSDDNLHTYAQITGEALDETSGTEDGRLRFMALIPNKDDGAGNHNQVGEVEFLRLAGTEGIVFNNDGEDINFRIEGDDETHLFYVDGGTNTVSIGASTNAPGGQLEVSGGTDIALPLLKLENNDTDQPAILIDAANTTGRVIEVYAEHVTTANIMSIEANSLTDGAMLTLMCDSSDSSIRPLLHIVNNNVSATGTTPLLVENDSPGVIAHFKGTGVVDNVIIESVTDPPSGGAPDLILYQNATIQDEDTLGNIKWRSKNDADEDTMYGEIYVTAGDVSDGTEDGRMIIKTTVNGTEQGRINIDPGELIINEDSLASDFRVESNGQTHMLFVDGTNNYVGIKDDAPISELSVAGKISITAESTTPTAPPDGHGWLYTKSDGKIYWQSNDVSETDLTSGGLTGSGSSNRIPIFTSATNISDNAALNWEAPSGAYRVVVGGNFVGEPGIKLQNDENTAEFAVSGGSGLADFEQDGDVIILSEGAHPIKFGIQNEEYFAIQTEGYIETPNALMIFENDGRPFTTPSFYGQFWVNGAGGEPDGVESLPYFSSDSNNDYLLTRRTITAGGNTLADTETLAFVAGTNVSIAESGGSVTITSTAAGSGISGIIVQEEGSALANVGTTLNFVGSSVTASGTGATKTITISGGGAFGLASGTTRIETTLTIAGNPSSLGSGEASEFSFVDVTSSNSIATYTNSGTNSSVTNVGMAKRQHLTMAIPDADTGVDTYTVSPTDHIIMVANTQPSNGQTQGLQIVRAVQLPEIDTDWVGRELKIVFFGHSGTDTDLIYVAPANDDGIYYGGRMWETGMSSGDATGFGTWLGGQGMLMGHAAGIDVNWASLGYMSVYSVTLVAISGGGGGQLGNALTTGSPSHNGDVIAPVTTNPGRWASGLIGTDLFTADIWLVTDVSGVTDMSSLTGLGRSLTGLEIGFEEVVPRGGGK